MVGDKVDWVHLTQERVQHELLRTCLKITN